MKKEVYKSKYKTELVSIQGNNVIVQYLNDEDKKAQVEKINEILTRRLPVSSDLKLTRFFETRSINLISNLANASSGGELVATVLKGANVSMSGYYRYRDVYDILKSKSETFNLSNVEAEILDLTLTSLEKNHVIAPKISAIYKKMSGINVDDELL